MATQKKRIVISLSDERAEEFEKLVRESGLTKSGLVTTWILKEIEKGQENKKEPRLWLLNQNTTWVHYTLWLKKNQDTSLFCFILNQFLVIGR